MPLHRAAPLSVWLFELVYLINVIVRSVMRGIDYLRTDDDSVSKTLGVAVRVMPIDSWGFMFILVGFLIAAGVMFRSHLVLMAGCSFGTVAWGYIAVAQGIEVSRLGEPLWRTPIDALSPAVLLAVLTGMHMVQYKAAQEKERASRG